MIKEDVMRGQVPYRAESADQAWIRLSWRVSTPRIEECRTLTAEELSELPVHMRRDEVCEGTGISYRLRIVLNGEGVEETLARDVATGDAEMETLELAEDLDLAAGDVALITRAAGGMLAVRRAEP